MKIVIHSSKMIPCEKETIGALLATESYKHGGLKSWYQPMVFNISIGNIVPNICQYYRVNIILG